jgi:hypothetical protein
MEITKLISALEAAGEGSEYLDYAIQRPFGLLKPVPAFTRSLDGAMLLLPAGWSIHRLCHRHDCRGNFTGWLAELYRAADAVIEYPAHGLAATAPLAICLASMRVRQQIGATSRAGEAIPASRQTA